MYLALWPKDGRIRYKLVGCKQPPRFVYYPAHPEHAIRFEIGGKKVGFLPSKGKFYYFLLKRMVGEEHWLVYATLREARG